jgi:hypothetical protein
MNVFPLRQISSNAFGSSAAIALASFSGRLTVMLLPPTSTPTKLFPATLNPAIRWAARTGGPSSTCGNAIMDHLNGEIAVLKKYLKSKGVTLYSNPGIALPCFQLFPGFKYMGFLHRNSGTLHSKAGRSSGQSSSGF